MKYVNKKKINEKINFKKKIFLNFFLIILIFLLGIWTERFDYTVKFKNFSKETINTFSNRIYSIFSNPNEKLIIDINYKNYLKILSSRSESIKSNRASEDIHKWVPANMNLNEEKYKIEIKLKGVHSEHWKHPNKWSFKIKLLDDKSIDGIKRFSIQQPKTRDFVYEWLFMKALKKENLISHRTRFIETQVNGNDLGIYFLEEQHSKQLIENNNRREGPIIGLDKNLWIKEANNLNNLTVNVLDDSFWRAKIKPVQFQDTKIGTEQELYLKNAIKLFENFRNEKISVNEAFDVSQLAKLMAIKALFGAKEFDWRDIKFYYNPITSLLEPIGREVHINKNFGKTDIWWIYNENELANLLDQKEFINLLYKDKNFYESYLSELSRLSEDNFLKKIILENEKEFNKIKRLLNFNFPTSDIFSEQYLNNVRDVINKTVKPIQGINAYFNDYVDNELLISIQNTQRLPVEIKGIKFQNQNEIIFKEKKIISGKEHNKPIKNFILKIPCKGNIEKIDFKSEISFESSEKREIRTLKKCEIYFQNMSKSISENNKILFKILGQRETKEAVISRFYQTLPANSKIKDRLDIDSLKNVSYLDLDLDNKRIYFKEGKTIINSRLIFPDGFSIFVKPGSEIILSGKGQIISFSPFNMLGQKKNPIIFRSNFQGSIANYRSDQNKNKINYGNGLSVINANSKSTIKNTIFKNLGAPLIETGEGLLGAINFYQSEVKIEDCKFVGNLNGDDFLNIISSKFYLKNLSMKNILYDAIDFDFSDGIIENIAIEDIGNDGLDFSGSNVTITKALIEKANDKGISVGEKSNIQIDDIKLVKTNIGVASKDLSELKIKNINVTDSNIGVAAYQKKPEYGPGFIYINNIIIQDVDKSYIAEENSQIKVNGEKINSSVNKLFIKTYIK